MINNTIPLIRCLSIAICDSVTPEIPTHDAPTAAHLTLLVVQWLLHWLLHFCRISSKNVTSSVLGSVMSAVLEVCHQRKLTRRRMDRSE